MNQSNGNTADYQPIQLKPVGVVRNQSKDPSWGRTLGALDWRERATRMKEQRESVSELVIDSSLEGILDGIDDFSHIMVIYWAHLIPPERRSMRKVHPMGNKDFPLVGVFATGSPVRPNSILTTVVRLVGRKGNVLRVTGLDALDGSPILDIKPYSRRIPDTDEIKVPDWMRDIHQNFTEEAPSE
jgi:tRNA-Thr(GGU) m(6)t(6)A37 methyltransferase TsaA